MGKSLMRLWTFRLRTFRFASCDMPGVLKESRTRVRSLNGANLVNIRSYPWIPHRKVRNKRRAYWVSPANTKARGIPKEERRTAHEDHIVGHDCGGSADCRRDLRRCTNRQVRGRRRLRCGPDEPGPGFGSEGCCLRAEGRRTERRAEGRRTEGRRAERRAEGRRAKGRQARHGPGQGGAHREEGR